MTYYVSNPCNNGAFKFLKRLILKLLLKHNYCYYNKKGMVNLGENILKLLK